MKSKNFFYQLATQTSKWSGSPTAFILAFFVIIIWLITGPIFDFSDTWQLIINTGTTIITFLMVFLIQNSQNRDTKALQIKLDELIRITEGAHTALLDLEELTEEEIINVFNKYKDIAKKAREQLRKGETDTHNPEVECLDIIKNEN
ncbi:MAG: low affinity iron permease family protein [Alphaproteobacteria bacterium]|nr:low affinity iron permease family protein [Alphaproteobacteria bacterium]